MINLSASISVYNKISNIKSQETIPLDIFLENIRAGEWEDITHSVRRISDKKERSAAKEKAPSVTISGKFTERTDSGLETHSGYIGIDIDNVDDPTELKSLLCPDKFIVAAFTSISGRGLCLLFKINPAKHHEAFRGISEYLFSQYKIICDPTSINPSRPRFVSYDPDIYIAEQADKFTQYPKNKPPKKIDKVIYSQDDFNSVIEQIVSKRLNIAENYHEWLRIGFALVHKFGEAGREYFHIISQYSTKYDSSICDKQYEACLKHKSGRETTISTFYYYAKNSGLDIYSERTKKIAYSSSQGRKAGLNPQQVEENLNKFEDIKTDKEHETPVADIIQQVFQNNIDLNEDTLLDQLEIWMRQNYNLQRNEITRYIENNSDILQQKDLNTIFIKAKKIFERITYDLLDRLVNSDFVTTYNPFTRLFLEHSTESHEQAILALKALLSSKEQSNTTANEQALRELTPHLTSLFNTIQTKDSDFCLYFGRKWFVGMLSSIYGEHSPLMFVLSGEEQNTGKTEWFRRLLPKELKLYYAESKLDAGKDDEILMTQKLLIMDDEMGGKSKKEVKRLKELTSKQTFSLREPYGRNNVDLQRLAVLAGTTNDDEILSDPTGNRRILPINTIGIDQKGYNKISKLNLILEVYCLYKAGFDWRLNKKDIELLAGISGKFEMSVSERELVQRFFEPGNAEQMTATDIKVFIEKHTQQKLILDRVSKELKSLGFEQKHIRIGKHTKRIYMVTHLGGLSPQPGESLPGYKPTISPDDDLPF